MEFSRPEYWSGWLFPSSGDPPNPRDKPRTPDLQTDFLPSETLWKPKNTGMLPDLPIGFSRGRSGGLVFPSLSEFSTVYCDPQSQRFWHSQLSRKRCFSGTLTFFDDSADVGNLISS